MANILKKIKYLVSLLLLLTMLGLGALFLYTQKLSIAPNSNQPDINEDVLKRFETFLSRESPTNRSRIAVISYIGKGDEQIHTFMTMLYGSWRYINDQKKQLLSKIKRDITNDIDLLAFCSPETCEKIQPHCNTVDGIASISLEERTGKCWAVMETREAAISYEALNSYIMFDRVDISLLIPMYKYLLRTDYDVFISPALLWFHPKKNLMFGKGGYNSPLNEKLLPEISKRLGLIHRGMHSVGSTWFGKTRMFIEAGKKTLEVTQHIFTNEFQPHLKGLEAIDWKNNPNGTWPEWYKPVSLLYGAEIVINHLIQNISSENQGSFDDSSCDTPSIFTTLHVHCWHGDCEFNKFHFIRRLRWMLSSTNDELSCEVSNTITNNMYERDITNMTFQEYSHHIAWYSVSHNLRNWFLKNN